MHWVIQENLHGERGFETLIDTLDKLKISYDLVKVVPFVGEVIPDVNPKGMVFVIGSMSMHRVAKKKNWVPGVTLVPGYDNWLYHWGDNLLNNDNVMTTIELLEKQEVAESDGDVFFMRPIDDTKTFSGGLWCWSEFEDWRGKIKEVSSDNPTVRPDTHIVASSWKEIYREFRFFVVCGKVVTGSLYKIGGKVSYSGDVEKEVYDFAQKMVDIWEPAKAFVIDIALTPKGFKIIEVNNLNSAGFYAADVQKLVAAIETDLAYDSVTLGNYEFLTSETT